MPWEEIDLEELADELGVDYTEMKAKHELIDTIKKARKKHKFTQTKLGELVGVSQSRIARIENGVGTKNMSFEILFRILEALGYEYNISLKKVSQPKALAA